MLRRLQLQAIAALAAIVALPVSQAFVFELGEIKGSFDTTLSVGGLYRLNDPSPDNYGLTGRFNGVAGRQRSVNSDDGNLNYGEGIASFLIKANHDLQMDYKDMGVFIRGYYFTDIENNNRARVRTQLGPQAQKVVGEGAELLDAYVYFKPTLGDMPARVGIGKQLLSWGESTFIPNGINSVNPIDVAKLRTPGSELKEALLPISMVSTSLGLTDSLTMEAFYLLDWERTRVDPPGTYFSTNDFVAKGGTKVYLGFGALPDNGVLGPINRGPDNEPGSSGQYGVNFRYLSKLNNTEFGFYFMNYHSRLPTISARTPTSPVNSALVVSDSAAALQANATFMGNLAAAVGGANVASSLTTLIGATLTGVPASALPAPLQPFYPTVAGVTGQVGQREVLVAAATGRYLIEFPEDIHLFGVSFNTNIGGVALQGEVSYRSNQPLQVDDVELLFAALTPLSARFAANQIGSFPLNTYIQGYRRHKVWTGQMTATKVTRGILGSDQTTMLMEAGFVNADLPAQTILRYDGTGTFVGGSLAAMNSSGNNTSGVLPLSEPESAFASNFSWGYQVVGRLDYNNAFKGVNVSPLMTFAHDVGGNTPLPMGNFIRGRKTLTIGADFTYQNAWALEIRYVSFSGAGRYNLLSDRDYVSTTLKYSF
ncbi:MAG: DUF1302 domain-containing protein [Candidatus Didemnitutus sp.]|nr:DUF1302 domain-containing protein [Candidatus Didemnitutus sp.]